MNKVLPRERNTITEFIIGLLIGTLFGTILLAHEYKVQIKELKAQITVQQGK